MSRLPRYYYVHGCALAILVTNCFLRLCLRKLRLHKGVIGGGMGLEEGILAFVARARCADERNFGSSVDKIE